MAKKKLSRDQKRKQKLQKRPHAAGGAVRQSVAEKLVHDTERIVYETFISYGRSMHDEDVLEAVNQLVVDVQRGEVSKQDASLESPNAKGALVWNIKQRWAETRVLESMPHLVAAQAIQALAQRIDGIMAPGESHSYLRFLQGSEQTAVLASPAGRSSSPFGVGGETAGLSPAGRILAGRDEGPASPTAAALGHEGIDCGTVQTDPVPQASPTDALSARGTGRAGSREPAATKQSAPVETGAGAETAQTEGPAAEPGPQPPSGDWSESETPLLEAGLAWLRASSEESWEPFLSEAARLTENGHAQEVANVSQYLYGLVRADAVEAALRPVLNAAHARLGAEPEPTSSQRS
jgi:hypothetical protein